MDRTRACLIFLSVIGVAVFGAGIVDIVFPDVVPIRPYTTFFRAYSFGSLPHANSQMDKSPLALSMSQVVLALVIVSMISVFLVYHVALIVPMGARGSHSRANRRAGSGWKISQTEKVEVKEQFRILREIFGDPRMVIIYERNNGFRKARDKKRLVS